jgi:hypothetical protein
MGRRQRLSQLSRHIASTAAYDAAPGSCQASVPGVPGVPGVQGAAGANAGSPRFLDPSEDRTNEVMRANHIARALPKTELHLHLDGSIPPSFICQAAERRGIELPSEPDLPAYIDELRASDAAKRPGDGQKTMEEGKNWGIFDWMCQFLQTEWELEKGTKALMQSLADDNVFYAEVRFCPELHTLEGLGLDQIVAAVCRGLTAGCAATGGAIRGGVIVCCLRSFTPEHSLEHAQLAHRFFGKGVLGFDVAGDEHYMLSIHEEAFKYCSMHGVPCTAHGGEVMAESDPEAMLPNLELALDLGGHKALHLVNCFLDVKCCGVIVGVILEHEHGLTEFLSDYLRMHMQV